MGMMLFQRFELPKKYRHSSIDFPLRKQRTLHEANIISYVKIFGVNTPFIYFLNLNNFEIIMEYINGNVLKTFFLRSFVLMLEKSLEHSF